MTPEFTYWYGGFFTVLFGAVIGSFLNVVIYRFPLGMSLISPGSRCGSCETPVKWYDNLPIISWFILRGKCRACGESYSFRYAAIELLVAAIAGYLWFSTLSFLHAGQDYPIGPAVVVVALKFTFAAFLITLTFIDLDHLILPHRLTFPGMAVGLAAPWIMRALFGSPNYLFIWPPVSPWMSFSGWLFGAISVLALIALYFAMTGMQGMGGGDVTLMALLGAWLGWPALLFVFFASSIQGLIAFAIAKVFFPGFVKDSADIFTEDEEETGAPAESIELDGATDPSEPDQDSQKESGDRENEKTESEGEDKEQVMVGKAAIPFGPFLSLAGLEFMLFGAYMPPAINMQYLYGF